MATVLPISIGSKRLTEALTASGTSFKINNIAGWDSTDLVAGDFGTLAYGAFRNANNTAIEFFSFDPSTIANTSITIIARGLAYDGDYTTEVSANKLSWGVGTIVELGAPIPQLLRHFVTDIGDQTVAGIKTFSSLPSTTAGDPVLATDLARKAYVDSAVAGIATTVNLIVPGTAGATLAAGDLIYFDDADNEWKLCDADTAATVENVMLGMAQGAGTDGNTISGGVLLRGLDANQTGLTAGAIYYASNTAGDISSSAGTQEVTIGFAYSTTQLYFNPRFNQEITELQQDYLEKASTNLEWYGASVVGTDSYAITVTPTFAAYVAGNRFSFKADVANTGAATLNVNGLGAITIKKQNDQDLVTGDIEAGQVVNVQYDGTNFQMQSQAAVAPATVDIQTFTSSGTWTKPTGAKAVDVYMIGGGGGGGGGGFGNGASVPDYGGGGGGGGGAFAYKRFLADGLSTTENVTVGAGGSGGAGGASPSTGGADGVAGGHSSFGTSVLIKANGGAKGEGGDSSASSVAGGVGGTVLNGDIAIAGGAGGAGGNSSAGTVGVSTDVLKSPRGGGGGGHRGGGGDVAGGAGGGFTTTYVLAGGTAGASTGGAGGAGNAGKNILAGGTGGGGGGGASTQSGAGGAGVDGGGGGGGGGCRNAAGGNGGAGGDGYVIVVTYS